MDMTGRFVVVTGAASGMGRATAVRAAECGAEGVACLDVHDPGNAETALLVEKAGAEALQVHVDLAEVQQIHSAYGTVMRSFGRVDLAAHLGGYSWHGPTLEITEEQWDTVVNVNLRGAFFCSQAALRIMYEQGFGVVVNTSADAAFFPMNGFAVQAAAKGGIALMSQTFALEAARRGVRVNCISPGIVKVAKTGTKELPVANAVPDVPRMPNEAIPRDWESQTVPGRWLEPNEIADVILFLASTAASGINGQTIMVNGGGYFSLQFVS